MQTMQAFIMGGFQGLTEFLPVSSSGHIVLTSAFYKLLTGAQVADVTNEEIFFDILVHLSTLFAVIIYFFKDLKKITTDFFKSLITKNFENENFKFGIYVICATFITCLMGLLIKDVAHYLTENPLVVSIFIIITGLILFYSEKLKKKEGKINLKTSLIIGFFQGLAIFPGISRSGMTISSAVFQGIKREDAARFSFILSVPIILIASLIYPLLTFDVKDIQGFNWGGILIGMAVSFVIGYLCIKYFMKFVQNHTLRGFAYYCWTIGAISALVFCFN